MYPAAVGMPRWWLLWFKVGVYSCPRNSSRNWTSAWGRSHDTEVPVANVWWMQIEEGALCQQRRIWGAGEARIGPDLPLLLESLRMTRKESERPWFPSDCPSPALLELG